MPLERINAVEANLLSLVKIVDDLQKEINALSHVCKVQDETINSLLQRVVDLEDVNCDQRLDVIEGIMMP